MSQGELASNDSGYLSKVELAKLTGLSPATIERYKKKGIIPFAQPAGPRGRVLYPLQAVKAAIDLNGVAPSQSSNPVRVEINLHRGPRARWRAKSNQI